MKRILLLLIIAIPLIFIVLSSLGLFKLVGITYANNFSLFLFLILLLFVDFIIETIINTFTNNKKFFIDFCQNIIGLLITDMLLSSVELSALNIFLLSLVLSLLEKFLDTQLKRD